MSETSTNGYLEQVKDLQMAFKSDAVFSYACSVIQFAVDHGAVWPDDVDVTQLSENDRNCAGSVFRWLSNIHLLERTKHFRRSEAEGAKGRTIFQHRLINIPLARTFLNRNEPVLERMPSIQQEFL